MVRKFEKFFPLLKPETWNLNFTANGVTNEEWPIVWWATVEWPIGWWATVEWLIVWWAIIGEYLLVSNCRNCRVTDCHGGHLSWWAFVRWPIVAVADSTQMWPIVWWAVVSVSERRFKKWRKITVSVCQMSDWRVGYCLATFVDIEPNHTTPPNGPFPNF